MLHLLNMAFRDSILSHASKITQNKELSEKSELEFRLVSFESGRFVQTLPQFKNIIEQLQKLYPDFAETYTLDIGLDTDRLTISDRENIKLFCQTENLSDIPPDKLIFIHKNKTSEDIKEYNLRIGLSDEIPLDNLGAFKKTLKSQTNKSYRYKHRYSFYGHPKIRFDLTVVKSGDGPSFKECTTIVRDKSSQREQRVHLFKSDETYEVELEFTNLPKNVNADELIDPETANLMYKFLRWSQRGFAVMKLNPKGEPIEDVLIRRDYKNLVFPGRKPAPQKEKFFFIGMNVYPLTIPDIESIKDSYSITDKADGERALLFIAKSKEYEGILYLINNQMEIKHTGIKTDVPELYGSVFDGELVLTGPDTYKYLIFDCLFLSGEDRRSLPLALIEGSRLNKKACRYGLIMEWIPQLNPTYLAADVNLTISFKKYEFHQQDKEASIFNLAEKVLNSTHEYKRDGLIFTPYKDSYPIAVFGEIPKWTKLFKWKPLDQLSIDFLIEFTKPFPMIDRATDITYIEAALKINQARGEIADFVPEDQPQEYDQHFNIIRLQVTDDSGLPRARDKNFIYNHSVVEFIYDEKQPNGFKWVPLRVRTDKMASNAQHVVDSTWNLILHPITRKMITGSEEIKTVTKIDQYYADVGEESKLVAPMREYHNSLKFFLFKQVTEQIRKNYIQKRPGSDTGQYIPIDALDIACGQGGDLPKWGFTRLNFVLGIDFDYQNLYNPERGAQSRMNSQRARTPKNKQVYPIDLYLVWGDSRKFLNNGSAGLNESNKSLLKGIMSRRGPASFDIVSCQFALHYFAESVDIMSQVLYNVSYNLKVGGYFIGTTLDGSVVHKKLKDVVSIGGEVEVGSAKKKIPIWKIDKKFKGTAFSTIGQQISVLNVSIGQPFDEYLVNFKYMITLAESFGLVLIDDAEIRDLTGLQSFKDIRPTILNAAGDDRRSIIEKMSEQEKEYSDMNSYFIFKKIRNPTKNPGLEEIEVKVPVKEEERKAPLPKEKKKMEAEEKVAEDEPEKTAPKKKPLSKKKVEEEEDEPEKTAPKKKPLSKKKVEEEEDEPEKKPLSKKKVEEEEDEPKKKPLPKKK